MRRNRDMRFLLPVGIFLVVSVILVFLIRIRATRLFLLPAHEWTVLGTTASYQTLAKGDDALREREIVESAFWEVEELFDEDRPSSLLAQLNRTAGVDGSYVQVRITSDFFHLLLQSIRLAKETDGVFDPTSAPLIDLWQSRASHGTTPVRAEIDAALTLVDWKALSITTRGPFAQISLSKAGMRIVGGPLARAYAVDVAYRRLKEAGAKDFLISLDGNIRVGGNRYKNRKGWKVSIPEPSHACSRSRGYDWIKDGEALSIEGPDPIFAGAPPATRPLAISTRSGEALQVGLSPVVIIAHDATTARALAKVAYTAGREDRDALVRKAPGFIRLISLDD